MKLQTPSGKFLVNTNNPMLTAQLVSSGDELQQILNLQQQNLSAGLSKSEQSEQGFVTVQHDLAALETMHRLAPSIIIKDKSAVIAYSLAMVCECRQLTPQIEPMFALFDTLSWHNKPLNDYRFYVMGQICVAKAYRGKGLVNIMYKAHKTFYQPNFDLLITEIATRNQRSMRAHQKAGFKTIHVYTDELDEWAVVAWDWA